MRQMILKDGQRLDGRATDEVRPIWCEVDYLPGSHGSAVFTRGETQSLTTVTLGSSLDENRIDMATYQGAERSPAFAPSFFHWRGPLFAEPAAEIRRGNLAQRALKGMVPPDNSYVIRIVSDILESNGSSSWRRFAQEHWP